MSEEFEDGNDSDGIKSLRKAQKELNEQNAKLLEELKGYRVKDRANSVGSFLKEKGVNEKAARLYAGEDTSEEALSKWYEEYSDLFSPVEAAENDENALAAARIAGASHGDVDNELPQAGVGPGKPIQVGDPNEALRNMKTLPYEELQRMGWVPKEQGRF